MPSHLIHQPLSSTCVSSVELFKTEPVLTCRKNSILRPSSSTNISSIEFPVSRPSCFIGSITLLSRAAAHRLLSGDPRRHRRVETYSYHHLQCFFVRLFKVFHDFSLFISLFWGILRIRFVVHIIQVLSDFRYRYCYLITSCIRVWSNVL